MRFSCSYMEDKKNDQALEPLIADPQALEFEMNCNCLYSQDSVKSFIALNPMFAAVKATGNWVGGTLRCYQRGMVFSVNALNRPFQNRTSALVIEYEKITNVWPGLIMFFFKTVDVELEDGSLRFRCWWRQNDRLISFLQEKIDSDSDIV